MNVTLTFLKELFYDLIFFLYAHWFISGKTHRDFLTVLTERKNWDDRCFFTLNVFCLTAAIWRLKNKLLKARVRLNFSM